MPDYCLRRRLRKPRGVVGAFFTFMSNAFLRLRERANDHLPLRGPTTLANSAPSNQNPQ